jgi:hypothetical protein
MPTLRGHDEIEAAELVVEFMREQAERMTRAHSRLFGLLHPLRFQGRYTNYRFAEDDEGPPSMTSCFLLEARGRSMQKFLPVQDTFPWSYCSDCWTPILQLGLHRIDWDEDPDLQGGVCVAHVPALIPGHFHEELSKFLDVTFGCRRIAGFSAVEAIGVLERLG